MSSEPSVTQTHVVVDKITQEADGVRGLYLRHVEGVDLPSWTPGAHVDVVLPSGLVRHYSLCGDPSDLSYYRLAVLREQESRGGSLEIHDDLTEGSPLTIAGPRNHFALVDAPGYLFIAGGIGITPLISMVREVDDAGRPWTLAYGARSHASMALTDELNAYDADRIRLIPQDEAGMLPLDEMISAAVRGTAIYCCGPEGLLQAVTAACESRGLVDSLHFERFTSASVPMAIDTGGDQGFEVELRATGVTVAVPADRSILDMVKEIIPDVLYDCEEGFCGSCETRVLEGEPEHRDTVLSEAERTANRTMMICVGRCRGKCLVLDL